VRYFNFYSYYKRAWPEPLNLQLNPDITVRDKGVMEKCTFCVQRIRAAKDKAKMENRKVRDGDVTPACVQACPTSAMMFGDTLDPDSQVSKTWKEHQVKRGVHKQEKTQENIRGYRIFEELNVDPSVMYLERIRDTSI
jgi:molybdopterin-containing oxidoreductase family iron-sulfur binding subunit